MEYVLILALIGFLIWRVSRSLTQKNKVDNSFPTPTATIKDAVDWYEEQERKKSKD
jgi:flagellar biogenesis protein FliO